MFWFFFLERYHWTEKVSEAGDGDFKVVFSFKVLENQTGTKAQDWKVPGPVHTRQRDQNTIQTSASSSSVGPSAAQNLFQVQSGTTHSHRECSGPQFQASCPF